MVFRNKIIIKTSADRIWGLLTDTGKAREWNPNVRALIPVTQGSMKAGFRYRVRYAMEHTENNFLAEVLEYEPQLKLSTHLTGGDFPRKGYALETYELAEHRHGVLVRQTIEIHNAPANIFMKAFAFFRYLVGLSHGKKALKQLKALAESAS